MVSMNRLSTEKRAQIIGCLVEGNSIRATVRMTGAAKNTVTKLLVDLGAGLRRLPGRALRDLPCKRSSATRSGPSATPSRRTSRRSTRATSGYGDVWTWTAICADTKLVPSWLVGERDVGRRRGLHARPRRPAGRPRAAHHGRAQAVPTAVGRGRSAATSTTRCSARSTAPTRSRANALQPGRLHRARSAASLKGDPDPDRDLHLLRRAPEPHDADGDAPLHPADQRLLQEGREPGARRRAPLHALQLRPRRTRRSRSRYPRTPAMAAGVADHVWTLDEIAALLD